MLSHLIAAVFQLVLVWVVLLLGKKWRLAPPAAGAVFFLWHLLGYQQYSSRLSSFAAVFDAGLTLWRYYYLFSALLWLGIAVWGTLRIARGGWPSQSAVAGGQALHSTLSHVIQTLAASPIVGDEVLSNDAIVKMMSAGLGEQVILEKIGYSRCDFSLSSSDLAQLKEKGVSDQVISRMLESQAKRGTARPHTPTGSTGSDLRQTLATTSSPVSSESPAQHPEGSPEHGFRTITCKHCGRVNRADLYYCEQCRYNLHI